MIGAVLKVTRLEIAHQIRRHDLVPGAPGNVVVVARSPELPSHPVYSGDSKYLPPSLPRDCRLGSHEDRLRDRS